MSDPNYIIGIDLGTTNSALSYVDLAENDPASKIRMFQTPQVSAPGELARLLVLPSFLYLPGKYDVDIKSLTLPWPENEDRPGIVGFFAQDQGARVPGRLVSSAKSWLCHSKVDRTGPILPWNADKEVKKVSPVFASASYLRHLKMAWNHHVKDQEEKYLENHFVIITVPASFDEVARDLTIEAARQAGFREVTLLEEPLAAFYSWLVFHENDWENYVKPGQLICAVDVGGGTTDFTLITLAEVDGHPRFERIAVGDHLILGGDNMDISLAKNIEAGFAQPLNTNRWQALCHQCRQAKEAILAGETDKKIITIMGQGASLIAGTLSATLERPMIEKTILDGFFPVVGPGSAAGASKSNVAESGLPYEPDTAITRHICKFLERHAKDVKKILGKEKPFPDLLLFNGGALKPDIIKLRIREAVSHWFDQDRLPEVLENPDLDLAVARGAAYYGLVKAGQGVRVGSGSARGYYLEVSSESGPKDRRLKALCLLERGVEEGTVIELAEKQFQVLANQPVSFQVYSSSFRSGDRAGDIISIDDTLTLLPPINTVIQFGKKAGQARIPVEVEAHYTENGTLSLWCCSVNTDHKWRLQFQIRNQGPAPQVEDSQVFEESVIQKVFSLINDVFGEQNNESSPQQLANIIAKTVKLPRDKWPLSLIRRIFDEFFKKLDARKIGPEYEARWLNLAGFCLRPGFGDALDEHRVRKIWAMYKNGPIHPKNPQTMLEWWVLWRRAAGGLSAGQQRQIFQDIMPMLKNKKTGGPKIAPQQRLEMWMLLANLERLLVKDKKECGRLLIDELHPKKAKPQQWWAISRLGSRELLYGPLDRVISSNEASSWINQILDTQWRNPKPVAQALAHLARRTGDRKRDLDEKMRTRVGDWLKPHGSLARMVTEIKEMDRAEENTMFGESLPAGIVLREEVAF